MEAPHLLAVCDEIKIQRAFYLQDDSAHHSSIEIIIISSPGLCQMKVRHEVKIYSIVILPVLLQVACTEI